MNEILTLLVRAKEYLYDEKFKEAEEYFKKVLSIDEDNLEANFYLGHIYQLKRELNEAKKLFDKVIRKAEERLKENEDIDDRYFLSVACGAKALQEFNPLIALKLRNKFFTEIDKVLQLNPTHADALWVKGRAKALTGNFNEAIELMKSALALKENFLIYIDLALIHIQNAKFEEAERYLLKAKELKPFSPTIYYNLYLLYKAKRDTKKADEYKKEYEKLTTR